MNQADQSSLTDEQENPSLVLTSPPRVPSEHYCGPVSNLVVNCVEVVVLHKSPLTSPKREGLPHFGTQNTGAVCIFHCYREN